MATPMTRTEQDSYRELEGTTALVTGGARGLGIAVSRKLAEAGAQVALVGRDQKTLTSLAKELAGDPLVYPADLSKADAPLAALDYVLSEWGAVDILVNNAGRGSLCPSNELTIEAIDEVLALNLRAPLLLAGNVAVHMAAKGGGSIINMSSCLSNLGIAENSAYAASKGGLDALTRSLAAEWGHSGVRVNALRPGVTRSDMAAEIIEDEAMVSTYLRSVPLGRVGEAEDVASLVVFLASDEGSYITGQVIDIDGGWGTTARSIVAVD